MVRIAALAFALAAAAHSQAQAPELVTIAGSPSTAGLIAVVVRDGTAPAPAAAPAPYEATLAIACNLRAEDPAAESKHLADVLASLPPGSKIHLWASGVAGLLARSAAEAAHRLRPID